MTTTVMVLGAFTLLSFMESLLHTVKGFFLKFLVIGLLALPGFYAYKQAGAHLPDLSSLSAMTGSLGAQRTQQAQTPQAEPNRASVSLAQSGSSVANPFAPPRAPQAATPGFKSVEPAPAPQGTGPRDVYLEKYGDPRTRSGAQGRVIDGPGNQDQPAYEREQARRIQQGYGQNPSRRTQWPPQGAYEEEDAYERAARERRGYRYQAQPDPYAPNRRQDYRRPSYEDELEDDYAQPPRYAPRPRPYGYDDGPRYQRQGYERQGQPDTSVMQGLRRWVGGAAGLN